MELNLFDSVFGKHASEAFVDQMILSLENTSQVADGFFGKSIKVYEAFYCQVCLIHTVLIWTTLPKGWDTWNHSLFLELNIPTWAILCSNLLFFYSFFRCNPSPVYDRIRVPTPSIYRNSCHRTLFHHGSRSVRYEITFHDRLLSRYVNTHTVGHSSLLVTLNSSILSAFPT